MSSSSKASAGGAALRVVLEGPVLLQCLLGQDAVSTAARQAWQAGLVTPLVSPQTARALILALAYPGLGLSPAQQQDLLSDFLPFAKVVHPSPGRLPGEAALSPSQRDVLRLAVAGRAQQLLCFSPDLLRWAQRPGMRTVLPRCQVLSAVNFFSVPVRP